MKATPSMIGRSLARTTIGYRDPRAIHPHNIRRIKTWELGIRSIYLCGRKKRCGYPIKARQYRGMGFTGEDCNDSDQGQSPSYQTSQDVETHNWFLHPCEWKQGVTWPTSILKRDSIGEWSTLVDQYAGIEILEQSPLIILDVLICGNSYCFLHLCGRGNVATST
jgi:hypothetical protein